VTASQRASDRAFHVKPWRNIHASSSSPRQQSLDAERVLHKEHTVVTRRMRFRTVWISDVHLGSRGSQARDLIRFLKFVECDTLYLVGDIIDFWRLKGRGFWPPEHGEVIQRILAMVRQGVRVIYVPGNHDEAVRQYLHLVFGGVHILPQAIHETVDGRRLLVIHGDEFDMVVKHSKLLSLVGSTAYEWLIVLNRWYNLQRRWRGKSYWSLSRYIKDRVKSACTFVSNFEQALAYEARQQQLCGVVCGHIHKAEYRRHDIEYFNCGDWVESCTAVVEHDDGRMEVIEALPAIAEFVRQTRPMESTAKIGS
jgi:UDP-2,3-diacylglucosamine pyrophosphatase LpxH